MVEAGLLPELFDYLHEKVVVFNDTDDISGLGDDGFVHALYWLRCLMEDNSCAESVKA